MSLIYSGNPEPEISHRAQWLHDQLQYQIKWGFKKLDGYAIRQGPLFIVEYPEIARLTDKRIGNFVYVERLFAWIYLAKGINEDSHELVRRLAIKRIFTEPIKIPSIGEILKRETLPNSNY